MEIALIKGFEYALFISLFIYVLKEQKQRDLRSEKRAKRYIKL